MDVMYARCAGCDGQKKTVVVPVLITDSAGIVKKQTRTFRTMTADLLALDEWLRSLEVMHIALESTGGFWHPVYNLWEEGRTHPGQSAAYEGGPWAQDGRERE